MSAVLRVAVLSFWHVHAADYAQRTLDQPGAELVAVWDDDPVRGRAGAEQFGARFEPDLTALLASPEVDAVIVTTATSQHRDVMLAAAAAGKHIFTEKVLAPTVAECDEIISAADEAGVVVTVSLPRLYTGYTRAITDVLDAGRLGRVNYSRVRLSHDGATANWLPERFYDPATAIGGALTDLGCHPVYLTQLFLGREPETITATYRRVTGRPLEDQAVVTVGYPDGAIGSIEAGFVSDEPFLVELHGDGGSLRYSAEDGLWLRGPGAGSAWRELPVGEDGPDAYEQWTRHIADHGRADDNLARAVELTRMVVAANAAAEAVGAYA